MADANRASRPLSPHLSIYKPEYTMVLSITHRITGVGLALGAALVAWWFIAAASGPDYFATVDGLLSSTLGDLVLLGSTAALWYHFCNGVRHLVWDAGYGFDLDVAKRSGMLVVAGTIALTVLTVALV